MRVTTIFLVLFVTVAGCRSTPPIDSEADAPTQAATTETQAEEAGGEAAEQDEAAEQEEDPDQMDTDDAVTVLGVLYSIGQLVLILANVL